jgi:hypothetical protein
VDAAEFGNLAGFMFGVLKSTVVDIVQNNMSFQDIVKKSQRFKPVFAEMQKMQKWVGLNELLKAIQSGDQSLAPLDVIVLQHWGKTADGRVVLLDHGATMEIIKNHYPEKIGNQ